MTELRADLWIADCGETASPRWERHQLTLLHGSERHRYDAFLRPERRRQFLLGRVLLRCALSDLFGDSPASWDILERPGRAPFLESDTPWPISFSLAHSRDRVACLIASGAMVGVDIEHMGRQRDFLGMAAHSFHPESVRQLQALPVGEQVAGFYRLWTLHEAALKVCNGCDGAWGEVPRGCGRDRAPVFVATLLGEYSLALAMCGDVPLPESIRQFRPGGSIQVQGSVIWDHHRVERHIGERASTPFFAPYSRSGIDV